MGNVGNVQNGLGNINHAPRYLPNGSRWLPGVPDTADHAEAESSCVDRS